MSEENKTLKDTRDECNKILEGKTYNFDECIFAEMDGRPCVIAGNIMYYDIYPVSMNSDYDTPKNNKNNETEIEFMVNKVQVPENIENVASMMLKHLSQWIEGLNE